MRPHRLAGPGQRPFTPSTGVQIPLGTPHEIKGLHENVTLFSYMGQIRPTLRPTDLEKKLKWLIDLAWKTAMGFWPFAEGLKRNTLHEDSPNRY